MKLSVLNTRVQIISTHAAKDFHDVIVHREHLLQCTNVQNLDTIKGAPLLSMKDYILWHMSTVDCRPPMIGMSRAAADWRC